MKLAVLKATAAGEARVAANPESVKKFRGLGLDVTVERGAGDGARFSHADYAAAGATIAPDARAAADGADIVLKVRGPEGAETTFLKKGAVLAALLAPHSAKEAIAALAGAKLEVASLQSYFEASSAA